MDLNDSDATAAARVIGLLEAKGIGLGFPYTSAITGSRYPIRELRIQSSGRPLRVVYAFDPKRQAILLLGGDKTGDNRFYARLMPKVESLWEAYIEEFATGEGE